MTLKGDSKRGDMYHMTRGLGGCYDCIRLCGTMLNTFTNKIVAICTEHMLRDAPHPRDGCEKSLSIFISDKYTGKKKRRKSRRKKNE